MASSLTIKPDASAGKDNCIISTSPTVNNGASVDLIVGDSSATADRAHRVLIAFDVSGVPAGATVTSVILYMYERAAGRADPGAASWDVSLRRVLKDWGEGTKNGTSTATGESSWRTPKFGGANWSTEGCSADDTDRVATASAALTMDGTSANAYVHWGSTAGMVADVQAWVDATAGNYGWLIQSAGEYQGTEGTAYNYFRSSDYYATDADMVPYLVIEYTPPFTTTAASAVLTTESTSIQRARSLTSTSIASILTASDTVVLRERNTTTTAISASLVASDALLTKAHVTLTTAASSSLVTASSSVLRERQLTSTATNLTVTSSSITTLRERILTTAPSAASLTVSSSAILKSYDVTTTAASASLIATSSVASRARSLTTASAAIGLFSDNLVFDPEAFDPLAFIYEYSKLLRERSLTSAASAAALSTSSSDTLISHAINLTTTASAVSLTVTGWAMYALDKISYTYALATSSQLSSDSSILRGGTERWLDTVASGASLTTSSSDMRRVLNTTAAAASLTAYVGAILSKVRSAKTTASSANLTTSSAAMGKVSGGEPATKYMSTFAASAKLNSSVSAVGTVKWLHVQSFEVSGIDSLPTSWIGYASGSECYFSKVTLVDDGLVNKLTVYLHNTSGAAPAKYVRGIIYSDNGGVPDALVAFTPGVLIASKQNPSWVDLIFDTTLILPAGDYWFGVNNEEGATGLQFGTITGAMLYGAIPYIDPPPSTAPYFASFSKAITIYARYNTHYFILTTATSGMNKESSGLPDITNLSTYSSGSSLNTNSSVLLVNHPVTMQTLEANAALNTLNTNSTLTFDPDTFDPAAFITSGAVPYTSLYRDRSALTVSTGAALNASSATLSSQDYILTIGSSGSLSTSSAVLKKNRHLRFAHGGGHMGIRRGAILRVVDTTNRPKVKGAKTCQ